MFLGDLVSSEISAAEEMDFSCIRRTLGQKEAGERGLEKGPSQLSPACCPKLDMYELSESHGKERVEIQGWETW